MSFLEFQNTFSAFPIIEVKEIQKHFPNFDKNALTRWQRKGYIQKIRNGYYHLKNKSFKGDSDWFFIANRIYSPSYVSLASALSYYHFIPEGVFTITSISTKKTQSFQINEEIFSYQHLKKNLFFGYQLKKVGNFQFKIASPEKTLLDYLYLNSHIESEDDFFELRLNTFEIKAKVNLTHWREYLSIFASKSLYKRADCLMKFIYV